MMTNQLCVKLRNLLIVCGKYADQYTARIEWTNDSHYTLSLMPIASASDQFTAWQAEYDPSGKLLATHLLEKRILQDGGLEFDGMVSTENNCSLFVLDKDSIPVIRKYTL